MKQLLVIAVCLPGSLALAVTLATLDFVSTLRDLRRLERDGVGL